MDELEARGTTGTVIFDGAFVTIHRTGASRLTIGKGHKQIPLDHITAVQFKPAGALVNGFIQFTLAGGLEVRSRAGSQTFNAAADENSVVFTRKQMPVIRGQIQGALSARIRGQYAPQPVAASDVQSRMFQLHNLLEQGMITSTEYDLKRREILGDL